MAHILPEPPAGGPPARMPPAPAPPSGWSCPSCGHSYAPWVPECHHCPEPAAFIAKTGLVPVHIDGMTCDPPCVDGPCGNGQ